MRSSIARVISTGGSSRLLSRAEISAMLAWQGSAVLVCMADPTFNG